MKFLYVGNAVAVGSSLLDIITDASQLTGLVQCLDAGDADSWTGSGGAFNDVSGQSNHMVAVTGGSGGNPAFHGVVGQRSANEYLTQDGSGAAFTETTAQTFLEPFHQNNATFTIMVAVYIGLPLDDNSIVLIADMGATAASARGIRLSLVPGGSNWSLTLQVGRLASPFALNVSKDLPGTYTAGWHVFGVSVNEASSSGGIWYVDGVDSSFNPTYSSPSGTAAATAANTILSGDPVIRYNCEAIWSRALSASDLDAVYAEMMAERFS